MLLCMLTQEEILLFAISASTRTRSLCEPVAADTLAF
jgi:hypothetical protein